MQAKAAALLAALVAPVCAVYQLRWLGDYQTGQWGTDAAESVAYDRNTFRAFIASAESATVQVVDVRDPVQPVQFSTLSMSSVFSACNEVDCIYEDFDFGGGSSPCGYATMVNVIFDKGDCSACASSGNCSSSDCVYTFNPPYNTGTLSVDPSVATAAGCQAACLADESCDFFSWEDEIWSSGDRTLYGTLDEGMHRARRCFLKARFGRHDSSENLNVGADCNSFVHWEAHKSGTDRGTHCSGLTSTTCASDFGTWGAGGCILSPSLGSDVACVAAGGTVTSDGWANGAPRYPYGFAMGNHYTHVYDRLWQGASGPVACGTFSVGSVQSVAVAQIPNYPNSVVAVAAPHSYDFADGMLALFDASTLEYLSCAPVGNKPEAIAIEASGKISCINEGSAMDMADAPIDLKGSMSMCLTSADSSLAVTVSCTTFPMEPSTFATGAWKHAVEFRDTRLRLYGPNGNNVTYDIEPEGAAFTEDGAYLFVTLQDNDGYAIFDVAANEYVAMSGFGNPDITMDASDADGRIDIKSSWGGATAQKMHMPDQVASFTDNGVYFFITANEGGSRDGGSGLLGNYSVFEGEEVRVKDLAYTVPDAGADAALGRMLTVGYSPSDYATGACGNNLCSANGLAAGAHGDDDGMIAGIKGMGAFKCIYKNADYGGCGAVCNPQPTWEGHESWDIASGCSNYPSTIAHFVDSDADNAYYGAGCTAPNCDTRGWRYASWVIYRYGDQLMGVRPSLAESLDSGSPLGYDSAVACQRLCDTEPGCDYWYSEYELGKFECFLKEGYSQLACNEFAYKDDHYAYATHGHPTNMYVSEGYASWSGPATALCVSPVPYSNSPRGFPVAPGTPGGSITVGGRSFTIWRWIPGQTTLSQVFDSGDKMETVQTTISGNLCDECDRRAFNENAEPCANYCPFNSDAAPPIMDGRSDDKGAEPECVTIGMLDGTRLSFVGMERTGGILVYDISNPIRPVFQDYLNVRNWMSSSADISAHSAATDEDAFMQRYALNDGPESLVFIPAAETFVGIPLLLAASPLAGRLTVYTIESAEALRSDDGSCASTAVCPYITVANGGTGAAIAAKAGGTSTYDPMSTQAGGGTYVFTLVVAGMIESFTPSVSNQLKATFAEMAHVLPSQITMAIYSGSVNIAVAISARSEIELANIENAMDIALGCYDCLTEQLGFTVEAVLSAGPVDITDADGEVLVKRKPPKDEKLPMWGWYLVAGLGATLLLLAYFLFRIICRERAGKPYFITVVIPE